MDKDKVADVLEKAADLYASEQVEWCAGSWTETIDDGKKLSVCASTAIGLAAGLGSWVAATLPSNYVLETVDLYSIVSRQRDFLERMVQLYGPQPFTPESLALYRDARVEVEFRLPDGRKGVRMSLPEFNDECSYDNAADREIPHRSKQKIIDLFKDTAKELRNS